MKRYFINGDGYTMTVTVDDEKNGRIDSDLTEGDSGYDETEETHITAQLEAVERLVLAHACAGIDVSSLEYVEGLNTVVSAIVA